MDITSVAANSPAAEAGIRSGDRIVQWNGSTDVTSQRAARPLAAGDTVRLRISRQGERDRDVTIVATERAPQAALLRQLQTQRNLTAERIEDIRETFESQLNEQRARPSRTNEEVYLELERVRGQIGQPGGLQIRIDTLRALGALQGARTDSVRTMLREYERTLPFVSVQGDSLRASAQVWRGANGTRLDSIVQVFPGSFFRDSVTFQTPDYFRSRADSVFMRMSPVGGLAYVLTAGRSGVAGAEFVDVTEGLRSYFGADRGALVIRVAPQTPAAASGLREGDVVVRAGETSIDGVASLRRAIAATQERPLDLEIIRERARRTVRLER
jgi:hypothetical protein